MNQPYHPEAYWDKVAGNISERDDVKFIAGDDEPYYRYKRKRFIELLDRLDLKGKSVLEIGSGPGGNLLHLSTKNCKRLAGADISSRMIELARKQLEGKNVEVFKTNGHELPFPDRSFDLIFTSTVLQHNTDEKLLAALVNEIARVAAGEVVLFERIEAKIKGHETNLGRPVDYYQSLFEPQGFLLTQTVSMPIQASYYACGMIRKVFNSSMRKEGEPLSKTSLVLENVVLPITRFMDHIIPSRRDVMMLHFKKQFNQHQ
jgi:ubiquinone/menaquinone biosynthesis C-methylase UbiE